MAPSRARAVAVAVVAGGAVTVATTRGSATGIASGAVVTHVKAYQIVCQQAPTMRSLIVEQAP